MTGPEKVFAAILLVFGSASLLCILAGWLAARRDRSIEEAQEDACCGPAAAGDEHDVWCPEHPTAGKPAVGRAAVVASDDLDPLEALYLAPAYGEEHAS